MLLYTFWNCIIAQSAAPLSTGSYIISNRNGARMYLTALNGRVTYGPNRGDTAIEFAFVRQDDSTYLLRNGNLCAYVASATPTTGSNALMLQACPVNPGIAYKFTVSPIDGNQMRNGDNGFVQIRSQWLGTCLDTYTSMDTNGQGMRWWGCIPGELNQQYALFSTSSAPAVSPSIPYSVLQGNLFLSAPRTAGDMVYQAASSSWLQQFTFVPVATRVYSIRSGNNCLYRTASNVLAITACPSSLNTNFMFRLLRTSSNSYSISNVGIDMCIDSLGSVPANGLIYFFECLPWGSENQQLALQTSSSAPPPPPLPSNACTNPTVRREFRQLSAQERTNYFNAIMCLKNSPSRIPGIGSPSRYDDTAYVHFQVLNTGHTSPRFLVWHRAFLRTVERILQTECGYNGGIPYWDWSLDSPNPTSSPVLNAFGPTGSGTGMCVRSGPFANSVITFGFGSPSCLSRDFNNREQGLQVLRQSISPEAVSYCLNSNSNYEGFNGCLENGPHAGIHAGIGGNPIFFSHHAMVDKVYRDWQARYPTAGSQLNDANGRNVLALNTVLNLWGLSADGDPQFTAGEMFSTTSGPLCYTYGSSVTSAATPRLARRDEKRVVSCRKPLEKAFIVENRLNETEIRKLEKDMCDYANFLNNDEKYQAQALNATIKYGRTIPFLYNSTKLQDSVQRYKSQKNKK